MAMPPPPPPPPGRHAPFSRGRKKTKSKLHPQAVVSRFWSKYHCRTPGKVTSIFPRKLYKGLASPNEALANDGRNAVQSYTAARAECEAMVRRAVARCEQTNSKFTDFDFDIETDHWQGERNCLYGLARPSDYDSDSDDDDPTPHQVGRSWRTIMNSKILPPTTHVNLHHLQKYLGGSDSEPEVPPPQRIMTPMSVHRLDWIFERPQFTVNGYSSSDIKQGSLGDCWWLAAVSNIAHRRDLMDKICVARDEECGIYGFVFHKDGEWIPTVVDDNLYLRHIDFGYDAGVYDSRGKKARVWKKQKQTGSEALFFSRCEEENETWLPLLEKAYAKVHGDYSALHGGWAGSGVEDLTGGVNNMILANRVLRKERLWREMLTIDQEKGEFVFALSASADFRDTSGRKNGIVTSHAYSVLRAVDVEDEKGNKQKLVKMRNPWGQRADNGLGEWHGPWSDGSREWTPHMIKRLQHEPADDGMFWMSFEDVLSNFKWIHRTRLFNERWTIAQQWTSENVNWVPGYLKTKFVLEVKQAGLTVIVLSKLDSRYFKGLEGCYWHWLEFIVRKPGSTEILGEARGFPHADRRSVNCEIYLEPGTYEIYPKVTSERMSWLESVESTVKREADRNPKKLRQLGMQYDIAHAKAGVLDEDAEREKEKEKFKRKSKMQRRKQEKINEMKREMSKMQTALSKLTQQVEQEDQKKGKDKSKDKDKEKDEDGDDNEKSSKELDVSTQTRAEHKEEATTEEMKLPPGFWPGDSGKGALFPHAGEGTTKEDKRIDNKTQSQSTQTRDLPTQPGTEPEPQPQPSQIEPEPATVGEPASPGETPQVARDDISASDSSDSSSDSDSLSDTDSVVSMPTMGTVKPSPWNPVCVMCLRVYAQDQEVSVKLVGKEPDEGTVVEAEVVKETEKAELEKKDCGLKMDEKKELLKIIEEAQEKFKIIMESGGT